MSITIDYEKLKGTKKHRFTFIRALDIENGGKRQIEVACSCGVIKIISWGNYQSNQAKSCGCLRSRDKWEGSGHPLRTIWSNIKQRCYNPNARGYRWYGAKGVTMCEEWLHDYPAFYKWCMNNGWRKGLQIDKDKNGGNIYSPENCVVVTHKENKAQVKRVPLPKEVVDFIFESLISPRKLEKDLRVTRRVIYSIKKGTYWSKYENLSQ